MYMVNQNNKFIYKYCVFVQHSTESERSVKIKIHTI